MTEDAIETLIKAQYKLPHSADTIRSITALHSQQAVIVSNFGVWIVQLSNQEPGFSVRQIHDN